MVPHLKVINTVILSLGYLCMTESPRHFLASTHTPKRQYTACDLHQAFTAIANKEFPRRSEIVRLPSAHSGCKLVQ